MFQCSTLKSGLWSTEYLYDGESPWDTGDKKPSLYENCLNMNPFR